MQINNQTIPGNLKTHDKPLELKQGEVYRAIIKDRSSSNEATVQIRGREVNVTFEGKTPIQDRVMIQISGTQNQVAQVRTISETPRTIINNHQSETANLNQVLRSLGVSSPSKELRQAAQIVLDKGVPLSQESVSHLRNFVEKEKGPIEQRLNTVQAVANKRLEITTNHLRSVHEALHGRPLNEVLTNIAKEIDPKFEFRREANENRQFPVDSSRNDNRSLNDVKVNNRTEMGSQIDNQNRTNDQRVMENRPVQERQLSNQVRQVIEQVQREPNVQRLIEQVRNEVVNNPRVDREVARQVDRGVNEARVLQQSGHQIPARDRLVQTLQMAERELNNKTNNIENQQFRSTNQQDQSSALKADDPLTKMLLTLQKEGDFNKVTKQIRELSQTSSFDRPTQETIERTVQDAEQIKSQGKELAARQNLLNSLNEIGQQVKPEQPATMAENRQYEVNEMFQGQQLSSKDLIVQTVTEKLAKTQNEFKQLQREITRNLDNSQRLLDMYKNQAQKQIKPILESTIKKIDNAILKSELMLFTDMKTEKNLMKASSQLAEAKKYLNKGNYQEASRIVQEVKTMIEKLVFKPSETKVKHFITKEQQNQEQSSTPRQLLQQFDEMTRQSAVREGSARQAFEMIRGLGLNRDSELAQILAGSRNSSEQEANQNLKSVLMKLMKSEDENVLRQSRQALANITGQQLLSKSDSNNNLQSIFMNLPFLLQDKVENLQVFVNSRKEGQEIDWENCNLYFLIETRKLGDVGILVTSTDRKLSLTIKNDQPFFKERMEPLAELCKENLKEVGYNITSLNFTKMTNANNQQKQTEQGQEEQQEKLMPIFTGKGYDFKI